MSTDMELHRTDFISQYCFMWEMLQSSSKFDSSRGSDGSKGRKLEINTHRSFVSILCTVFI